MRGKGKQDDQNRERGRITPAYAGKSLLWSILPAVRRDHPRLCGEKFGNFYTPAAERRITPAYAGKSDFFQHIRC